MIDGHVVFTVVCVSGCLPSDRRHQCQLHKLDVHAVSLHVSLDHSHLLAHCLLRAGA
jgi:hypothetical protein